MAIDRTQTARGALAGVIAAAVWAAQQPLDKRVFGVEYDDCDLLGSVVAEGPERVPIGWAIHLANGAAFGAVYANLAPRIPLPSWARGPAAALGENFSSWPLTAAIPVIHPRGKQQPKLWGSGRALAQATWRHLLFGTVLGELERRLNAPAAEEIPDYEHVVSSNGHGNLEHAVVGFVAVEPEPEDE